MQVFPRFFALWVFSVLISFLLPAAGQECLKLEPEAAGWSAVNAVALATASGLAYEQDAAKLRTGVEARLGMTDVEIFSRALPALAGQGEGGLQGFLAADDRAILLVFRGTEQNVADLLTDLWFRPVPLKEKLPCAAPGRVHEGFATALASAWPLVKPKLAAMRERHPEAKLWITGHSMGGSLALTAAAVLLHSEPPVPVQGVTVFGTPATGDPEFCDALGKALPDRVHRCVCSFDLVGEDLLGTVLKPWQYRVPGQLVYLDAGGGAHRRVGGVLLTLEMMRFAADLEIGIATLKSEKAAKEALAKLAPRLVARHSIGEAYLPALRRHLQAGGKVAD